MKRHSDRGTTTVKKVAQQVDPEAQIAFLRKELFERAKTIKVLQNRLGSEREFAERVSAAIVAAEPFPLFHIRKSKKETKAVVACIKLSDWHIGERIRRNETEGFGTFNYDIAEQRIFSIVEDFLKWVATQRTAYVIDEIAVFGEGDYVSGDIHDELLATNEFPLPEQTAKAGLLLGEVVRRISGHAKRVSLFMVGADNHGRLRKKPQGKQKTTNNMSYLVHTLAMSYLQQCNNIHPTVATGAKLLTVVNGFRILSEHGDAVKGWAGLPYYGFNRMIGKEATRRMLTRKGFHYWSIGHFHVPSFIEGRTLVNGSLSGTSEFDHINGRHALPSQVAYLMHPVHGMFNMVPFTGRQGLA